MAALLLLAVTSNRVRTPNLPAWASWVLTAIIVVLSVLAIVYVYLTGDSGAASVWSNTF